MNVNRKDRLNNMMMMMMMIMMLMKIIVSAWEMLVHKCTRCTKIVLWSDITKQKAVQFLKQFLELKTILMEVHSSGISPYLYTRYLYSLNILKVVTGVHEFLS